MVWRAPLRAESGANLVTPADDADAPEQGAFRRWLGRHPRMLRIWRAGVACVGGCVLALGIVLLPLPGPGWIVIFFGLGILATEFAWAAKALKPLKRFWVWLSARMERRRERRRG
ncbi:TIGR02611 family protein [Pseudoclavibacter sp. CFCC 14310]|nr:TIGR02611 family protein [Pseudoclavibacter sp. CFCC 14310]KAB1645939.1 TIGR02611 family protein [Pseudoclavibacter sp. CFCC 14310]KAB1663758.1 TIGR02611 family protein [Pseudoclavibacter sp. CFCC 13611]KAB1664493.1 TIGR02611 family protein [Pseudoclavibacter sp. CFCC 13611]